MNDSKVFIKTKKKPKKKKKKIQKKNVKHWLLLIIWLLICLVIKNLNLIVTELFIRGRKLKISFVSISHLIFHIFILFCRTKNIRPDYTHYFIMKTPNWQKLQQITLNHSSDLGFRHFMSLYKKCTAMVYIFFLSGWCCSWNR